ncbi:MAG: GAK system CofD-like protein [Pseudomonadota bacterium]
MIRPLPQMLPAPISVNIGRRAIIPDPVRITRYLKAPELGPRILFFSGGTALKRVSKHLINYTHNSIHIITAFDSGGSSAAIRDCFQILAIGDLRNRLMALADQSVKGNPGVYRLFSYRLPVDAENDELRNKLCHIADGNDSLVDDIPISLREIICNHLHYFLSLMPDHFDLRGANIGNLILAGGYMNNHNNIETALYLFSRLAEVRGIVKPVTTASLHLAAEMENGEVVIGQHVLTGKGPPPIRSAIKKIFLSESRETAIPVKISISREIEGLVAGAELICYPMGSFYTSVLANFLPEHLGAAVAANHCPKVYVPNTLADPEQRNMNLINAVEAIIQYLQQGTEGKTPSDFLNFVIIDSVRGRYPYALNLERIEEMGVNIIDTQLITQDSFPYIDPACLNNILLSLI